MIDIIDMRRTKKLLVRLRRGDPLEPLAKLVSGRLLIAAPVLVGGAVKLLQML